MNTPLEGPVRNDGPSHERKMRGIGAFFGGAWPRPGALGFPAPSGLADSRTVRVGLTRTHFPSGRYDFRTRLDIAEKYMFSAAGMLARVTGFVCLLLQLDYARPASFGFGSPPEGSLKSLWFNNENDNLAVPMQPKRLSGVKPNNFGSSGFRPANTNGTYQTTNLDEPTST